MLVQDRRRDRGAISAGAVHPDLTVGQFTEATRQLVHRDVDRLAHVTIAKFVVATHIQYGDIDAVNFVDQRSEVSNPVRTQLRFAGQLLYVSGCRTPDVVNADAHEFPSCGSDLVTVLPDQGQWLAPCIQPAQIS